MSQQKQNILIVETKDGAKYQGIYVSKDTQKQTKALYNNYQQMANNYGVNAERIAQMGLANSGYSETSKVNLYNTYQRNVTETLNNAQQLKADFDFQINQARQTGNITLAQNQLALYQQRMELLSREYDMRQQANQFAYQQQRDTVADRQWQQNFDYQKQRADVSDRQWQQSFDYQKTRDAKSDSQWQQTFDYQKSRDAVADSQWERQFELSKKATTSARSRASTSKSSTNGDNDEVVRGNEDESMANLINLLENNGNPFKMGGIMQGYDDSYQWQLNPEIKTTEDLLRIVKG